MKTNSSPGMDGLTAAFYQVAPTIFGECLCIVFNHHLQVGRLSQSQRQSAIVLLYKKGMRACPSNYRPIALICVDLKVLSKTLTFRLQAVLNKLIHPDQKAFVRVAQCIIMSGFCLTSKTSLQTWIWRRMWRTSTLRKHMTV
ncbi:hypothetical protein Plhal703r1_c48g0150981 [Plasmopara halstedii]